MVLGYYIFIKSLGMVLGYIVPLLILSNIDPLDARGAAASKKIRLYIRVTR